MRSNGVQLPPVDAVTGGLALRPIIDKTGLYEHLEMLGNRRLGKIELADNILAAAGVLHHQLADNLNADRMTQRRANARCRFIANAKLLQIRDSFG